MVYPLTFAGSNKFTLFMVDETIVGWGRPDANYFFQMWRDVPSHVIHYRNLIKNDFLKTLTESPVEPPKGNSFRYDYLAKGEDVPSGFWIQFNAGIDPEGSEGFVSNILYKRYSADINNMETISLLDHKTKLSPRDLFILLTNLGSSTGIQDIVDETSKNVLVGGDDRERREFNENYYNRYFDSITRQLLEQPSFISHFLQLSGIHILAYLVRRDETLQEYVKEHQDTLKQVHPAIQHTFLFESGFYLLDDFREDFNQLTAEMKAFQETNPGFYANQ